MPGLHDIDVSGFIKEQLPSFVQDNSSQQFQAFLEAYYQWLELVQIDVTRDVSELFYKDQVLFGTRSQAQATIFAVKRLDANNSRVWVRYISEKKFFTNETLYTEGLSWDDEVAEHANRFDVEFWSKSPGADYTAPVKEIYYNVILATSYMLNLQDIDYTDLAYFEETYRETLLHNFPELEEKRFVNERQLAKMIRTFNNRKGVDKTIKFLFKLVYGEDVDVFFPNTLLLRASDGRWTQPIVTFLGNIPTQYTLSDFVGMRIRGKQSRVEAIVINSYKNQLPNKEVNVLELQGLPDWVDETGPGIPGNPTIDEFIVGEEIEVLPATFIEAENFANTFEANLTATIRGGVGNVEIYAAGSGYAPGQMITLTGQGGAEAKAEIRLISNNYAVDFINVNSQGTGYIIGDELEWQPAFSGGINQSAEVGELTDTYSMYHSFQQIYPYGSFYLTANATWEYNTREAANISLYYTIQLPTVFANGDAVYSHNLHPFEDYQFVQGQNITFTHSEGTENAFVQVQHGDKNATFRVRLYENNSFSKATHPIHEINEITLEDGTTYDRIVAQGDVHANVEFQHMRIDDSIVYINQVFGGLKTINITSTGKEFFDVPGVTVRGRSNTGVYQSWTSNTEYVPNLGQQFGKYSTSAFNVITIQTEESTFVFANGFSNSDPDYPDSRVDVMELVRTGVDPADRTYVHGNNAMGETRAELVGVLDLESIAYFVQEDYGDPRVIDSFFILLEDDPLEEDRFVAEGDTVVMKVLFNEDVADPFLSSQTMTVRDVSGNELMRFDATTITDFRKMGTDAIISVPYLATNSIFDIQVLDPGSDYGADYLPIADTNTFGNMNAILIPHLTGTIKYDGDWKGYHGMLSSPHVLQDSYYWQDFSYSIRSGFEIAVYRDLVKRLLHIAGEQLFGEMLITINVNAQLYSGGEYGGKYDNNYLIDANSHTTGPFGGPFQDRPFFNLEREFLFTGPDGTVAPYGTSPWPNNPDDQYAQIDGRMYDIQINHEPIPHDGLFYANGAPVTYVVTPGKRYANFALNEVMDRFIVENPALRPEGLLMEEQDGSLNPQYIYSEFPDILGDNQFNHGERVNWTMFRDMRERGEIVWIDDSLEAQRFGYPHQVPDDSFEGAWHYVDLEGKNIICEDASGNHTLIYEDSNQDLFFPTETYTASVLNGATVVSTITNSSEMVIEGLALNTDQYTGVKVGQEVEVTFTGYEPGFQDSGYNIEISEPYDEYLVAVEPAYEDLRGQMQSAATFSPGDGTWGKMYFGHNPYISHNGGPNGYDAFAFQNGSGNPFYMSGVQANDFVYVGDQQGNIGYYRYIQVIGGIFAAWELEYISGHRFVDITAGPGPGGYGGGPFNYYLAMGTISQAYAGKVNLQFASGGGINRADFTASIEEIGLVDPAIESLTVDSGGTPTKANPSVYLFEQISGSDYFTTHVSGPVLDWGGPTDIYGGSHNAIIRLTQDQIIELQSGSLPDGDHKILASDTNATVQNDTFLGRDLGGQTEMDVFPGYNYGEFNINGQTIIADVRYRGRGAAIWNTIAAGLQVGDLVHAEYVGYPEDGTAEVLHIDHSAQIIYMKGTPSDMMISWSHLSYTDKDISKREILDVESVPMTSEATYNFTDLGSNRYHIQYVSGELIDFGGPTDRFNQGFETTLQIEAEQTYRLQDPAGNLYTGPALDLEIIDVDPYVDSGKSDGTITRAGSFGNFGDGNYYTFDNVDSTGFTIGDIAYIKGEVANGYPIDFKGEVVGTNSLTVKLPVGTSIGGVPSGQTPGYKNLSAFLYSITPKNTGVNDYLNTDFSYANYTFTPTGVNDEYTVAFVSGDELDFGNENAVYGVFSAPTTYLDVNNVPVGGSGAHATYLYDQYGPFTATITDTAPFTVTMDEDLAGSFLTTDISVTRQEITQTFAGAQSFPWYFSLETDTPGAGFEPISFDYPHWALDGTVFAESQHEIETQLPVDVTTWNFFNPLFDEERHISDYDGTIYRDWRDNPTAIDEPYRFRYDVQVASNEIPDILDHYVILEDQNQDNVGNRYLIYEDGSIVLKESYTDDWAQAVTYTEANGSVHSHRDWFAFSEPTIVYHNKEYVTTEVPIFLRDMGDFKPIPAPTIDVAPNVSMNVHVEVRGHGLPLIPTEFHYVGSFIDPDLGWINPEYLMYADMEMQVISDLGDFKAIDELKVAVPTAFDAQMIIGVGINETAVRLPLGKPCGRLVNEDAFTFVEPIYAQLIHTPVSERADYYPPVIEITPMSMVQETLDALLYEDGVQMFGEQHTEDYVSDTASGETVGYVKNHWFHLEGFDSLVKGPADDPLQIGGYFPKQVSTTRGQGVGFLELESDECGMIPIEYHKEFFLTVLYEPTIFAPHYYDNVEYQLFANTQVQFHNIEIEHEYSFTPYMHPSVMYVEKVSEVQDHTLIPYGLQQDTFGYHHFLEDGGAIMFEDNGYILDERIPEAVRNIRYNWELVDRQFAEYGYGSDLSRDMRGWQVIREPGIELDLLDPPNTGALLPTMLMPGVEGGPQAKYWFQTEDGQYYLTHENGDRMLDETPWWAVRPHDPRHVEIYLVANVEMILPFEWKPANTEIIVPPQVVITTDLPEYELVDPFFMDLSATITPRVELDLAEVKVATIWYNFPKSPVYRWYDQDSDLRYILDGVRPEEVEFDNYLQTETGGHRLTYEDGFYMLDQVDTEHQPKDIGACVVFPIEERSLMYEFIVQYDTATIYTYYEPDIIHVDEDLIPRVMDDLRFEEEVFLYASAAMLKVESNYPYQIETELDIDNTILDVTGIVLPIHEEHDAIPVGTLHADSPFAEPHYEHLLLIDYRPTLFGETGQAPELLGFITQIPTVVVDLTFEDMIFDTDLVMAADVFPYSQTDAGPNHFGLTPYENVWYPIGDTVLTHMRNDFNGLRVNNYESFPLAKQQDSDFNSANNQWTISTTFYIDTMSGINDGQNRGNQGSSKWDPFWIWSQATQNDGPGFRLGVNNRFLIFAYGRADASETFIARLKLADDGNFNQNYRTRINEWYNITVTYNGMSCQEGINKNRQDFLDTEWTEGVDDPMHNQFRFYMTDLTTGVVTELEHNEHALSYANVTLSVPENFTVGGAGPETLRQTSNTGDFSSFYEHGLRVAGLSIHNRRLSIKELQGTNTENRSGFALDPMGWKRTEDSSFVYVNELDQIELEGPLDVNLRRVTSNTTQIWLFGDSRNDGFVQQAHAGIYSTVPNGGAQLNDTVNLQPFGLFLLGENTTHFSVDNTNYGIGKNTPDFGTSYQLFAGDVSYIEIDYRDPFIANNEHITAQGGYTFAGNTSSLKTEYDFTHTGITADVSNLVPFDFFPIEITPFLDLTIQAYGDPLMGGNSALNNSNSQIVLSVDYDWSTVESDIDRRVLDHQQVDLGITEIPLTTLLFESFANTITADPDGSIVSDHGIPGRASESTANVAHQLDTTSDGRSHVECNPVIIQYGPDRMLVQGDDVRLHGLIIEEPYQFILAEEDDTPIITEIYEGEDGLTTELDVFILAEGTYDTMILDSEMGGEPFFLQTETGLDLDLELFEEYGDSIIAGYDTLHDFVLTERYDTVQHDDWILTHDGHTIIAEEKVRAHDSEIILDSISNPRTIDDIAFEDFNRFDTHDGVSTLD